MLPGEVVCPTDEGLAVIHIEGMSLALSSGRVRCCFRFLQYLDYWSRRKAENLLNLGVSESPTTTPFGLLFFSGYKGHSTLETIIFTLLSPSWISCQDFV